MAQDMITWTIVGICVLLMLGGLFRFLFGRRGGCKKSGMCGCGCSGCGDDNRLRGAGSGCEDCPVRK